MSNETQFSITRIMDGQKSVNTSKRIEVVKPFAGIVKVVDIFPPEVKLDPEAQQYVTPSKTDDMKYFLAKEDDSVAGFAVCQFPKDEGAEPLFTYRYVFPEHRRRGVGQILRNEVYKWLASHEYRSVGSGINRVLKIQDDGSVVANLDTSEEGGWKSYLSMTKTSPDAPIQHKVTLVCVDSKGFIDLDLETTLTSSEPDLLPTQPDKLMEKLFESGVLPTDRTTKDILETAQIETVVAYAEGQQLSFQEWLKRMRPR
jgi:GNAT superfamily N-acetyltransferase